MKSKTYNLLSIIAAFYMVGAGILAIYNEDMLYTSIGIYFIAKGLFVLTLMQRLAKSNCCNNTSKK